MEQNDLDRALAVAKKAAMKAGELVMNVRRSGDLDIHSKGKIGDFVTRADKEAELLIRSMITEEFPDHGIIGEEGDHKQIQNSHLWIIDPIDGTSNFVHGRDGFGVSIGLAEDGTGIVGVIVYPALGITLAAAEGKGTTKNDQLVIINRDAPIGSSMVDMDFPAGEVRAGLMNEIFLALGSKIGHPRIEGAVVLGALGIINGTLDAYVQPSCNNWDCAALDVILREAGALSTEISGELIDLRNPKTSVLAACSRALHESLTPLLVDKR